MDIGKEKKRIKSDPISPPVPQREPVPTPGPERERDVPSTPAQPAQEPQKV